MIVMNATTVRRSRLRVALIADDLTRCCLEQECSVRNLTPLNYRLVLRYWKPDVVLVESAWEGHKSTWKYKVASYPARPERNNRSLARLVAVARSKDIPTVFWNKEDGVHFERFIGSAALFDHILTVDANCVPRYKSLATGASSVGVLPFPVQPAWHNFTGFNFRHNRANFVGSYSRHIHGQRRMWQDTLFEAACTSGLGLTIIDRNSDRKSDNYRYPNLQGVQVLPAVSYAQTAQVYKNYLVSLNVNTIEDSETMYSRRLVEILACGGIAVTNPSVAVERHFKDFCHVVRSAEEAFALFSRLKHGPSALDLERAEAGARYVAAHHTWAERLQTIARVAGLR